MKTVREYCELLGWNIAELQRQAGLSYPTAYKAYHAQPIQIRTKKDICSAFAEALNEKIEVRNIQWTSGNF